VGPEAYLLAQERGAEERVQIDFRKARCEPFLVGGFERFAPVLLVAGAKQIAVGAGEGGVLACLPEASDLEIAGQMIGVGAVRVPENRGENLGCTVEFPVAWGGVDEFESGQPT
jgi:hypothetical protein